MGGIEEIELCFGKIAKTRMRALFREDLVIFAPDDQRRRLAVAEECLELWMERQVGAVVVEQVELDILVPRQGEQRLVVHPVVGAGAGQVLDSIGILEFGRLRRDTESASLSFFAPDFR